MYDLRNRTLATTAQPCAGMYTHRQLSTLIATSASAFSLKLCRPHLSFCCSWGDKGYIKIKRDGSTYGVCNMYKVRLAQSL